MSSSAQFLLFLFTAAHASADQDVQDFRNQLQTFEPLSVAPGSAPVTTEWTYCDENVTYCPGDSACCFPFSGKVSDFKCMKGLHSTCNFDGTKYCFETHPIFCGGTCCTLDENCIGGTKCEKKPGRTVSHEDLPPPFPINSAIIEDEKGEPQGAMHPLKWRPYPRIFSGASKDYLIQLQHEILPHWAGAWRKKYGVGQCIPIGFPKVIQECEKERHRVLRPECYQRDVKWVQEGKVVVKSEPVMAPIASQGLVWCNDDTEEIPQGASFSYRRTDTQTTSTTFSETMSVGATISEEVGIQMEIESAKMKVELSTTASTTNTHVQTKTTTKYWETSMEVKIGPRRRVKHKCWLDQATFSAPFSANGSLSGNIEWVCTVPKEGPIWYIWTPKREWKDIQYFNHHVVREFGLDPRIEQSLAKKTIRGTFTHVEGINVSCSTHSEPLKPDERCFPVENQNNDEDEKLVGKTRPDEGSNTPAPMEILA